MKRIKTNADLIAALKLAWQRAGDLQALLDDIQQCEVMEEDQTAETRRAFFDMEEAVKELSNHELVS